MKRSFLMFALSGAAALLVWPSAEYGWYVVLTAVLFCLAFFALGVFFTLKSRTHLKEGNASALMDVLGLPVCTLDERGEMIWRNKAFIRIFGERRLAEVFPVFNARRPGVQMQVFEKRQYELQTVIAGDVRLVCALDVTERERLRVDSSAAMSAICIFNVDNYEELGSGAQLGRASILSQFEHRLEEWAQSVDGFLRRYDRDRYLLFIDRKHLDGLRRAKFPLLAMAHEIDTGGGMPLSLTVAAGTADSIRESGEFAKQALELALGRGGDQAVVKDSSGFTFYGGTSLTVEKASRVKIRTFARALYHLVDAADALYLVGHKMPDLDCMGAALGLFRMARVSAKPVYIVLDRSNVTIERLIEGMRSDPDYAMALITPEAARSMCTQSSVLAVFDTQRKDSTIEPALFEKTKNLVLIDHHRRGLNAIDDAVLSCVEPYASSTCELVTEILQYYAEGCRPKPFESSALLAGISVDTKNFTFNAGARTFEAASFLRRNGADMASIKRLSQDDMNTYADRAGVVQSAKYVTDDIVIALCSREIKNAPLIAAQAADALTTIRGIKAAFVAGMEGDYITVSGRSLGEINVQLILERVGGGGHMTSAGAQFSDMSLEKVDETIRGAIFDYLKEVERK